MVFAARRVAGGGQQTSLCELSFALSYGPVWSTEGGLLLGLLGQTESEAILQLVKKALATIKSLMRLLGQMLD